MYVLHFFIIRHKIPTVVLSVSDISP